MKKETVTTNQITEGVIWKQLLLFFFPIVLGTFFQQLYNTADTIVVGRFVSKEALAAVGGSAAQIVGLIVGFFVGLASGASVIISQFYGAKNRVQLNRALHTAYAFSIIGSIFITVLGILIAPWMLELMHTPQETMADALLYLRIYFAGIIFVFIYNVGSSILRAMGDSRRPLYYLIVCCILNIVLDIVLVLYANMGVVGAALLAWAAGFGKRWLRNAVIALYVFLTERQHMPALPWYRKLWFAVTFPLFDVIGRISTVIALFSHVDWKPIPHDCAAGIDEMQTAKTAIS